MDEANHGHAAPPGGAISSVVGARWSGVGQEGRREAVARWRRREASLRAAVGHLWQEHGAAFAAYWQELETQPEVRAAMLITALHDLLSTDEAAVQSDDDKQEETVLGAVLEAACPELQDVPRLLASPDALLTLLAEPHRQNSLHQEEGMEARRDAEGGVRRAVREHLTRGSAEGEKGVEEAGAQGEDALRAARGCCLLQLGCNLVLLSSTLDRGDEDADI